MAVDLSTDYLGLKLRNPLIVGASSLTRDVEGLRRCEEAGAGAVVLKSLFEEQIRIDQERTHRALSEAEQMHAEVFAYMEAEIGMQYGPREYLEIVREARAALSIPVIASINCVSPEWWPEYAQQVEAAGANALELNIAIMPESLTDTAEEIEARYENIVRSAREAVSIPVAVKIGPWFTCLPETLLRLQKAGADAFVLFNRFYRPTIDVEQLRVIAGARLSSPAEISLPLRWISFFAGRIRADLSGATGVHSGLDIARMLLAGATTVQVVSALYIQGIEYVTVMLRELGDWMTAHEFDSVAGLRGLLSQTQNPEVDLFRRLQYIRGLVGVD